MTIYLGLLKEKDYPEKYETTLVVCVDSEGNFIHSSEWDYREQGCDPVVGDNMKWHSGRLARILAVQQLCIPLDCLTKKDVTLLRVSCLEGQIGLVEQEASDKIFNLNNEIQSLMALEAPQ